MKHSRLMNILLTVLLFISTSSLFGQKFEPKKRLIEPDTTITSKIMGKDYQLYISFPRGYSTKDTIQYPVLYVLDGWNQFPTIKSIRETMDIDKELEDVIIVGVSSGLELISWGANRNYDYTPSQDSIHDREFEKVAAKTYNLDYNMVKGQLKSGGAEKFLQCITTEIIPYVETHYKATNDRGISGNSLGGLFTAWCFLNTKGIFTRFAINSPSLWWNNSETLTQAEFQFSKNDSWDIPPTKIFISVGDKEPTVMISGMEKFSKLLEAKAYKNISLTSHQFMGENHNTVVHPNLKRTITVLYGKKK